MYEILSIARKTLTSSQVQHFSLAVMPVSLQYSSSGGSKRITSNLDFSSLISKASKSACKYLFKQKMINCLEKLQHCFETQTPHSTSAQQVKSRDSHLVHESLNTLNTRKMHKAFLLNLDWMLLHYTFLKVVFLSINIFQGSTSQAVNRYLDRLYSNIF